MIFGLEMKVLKDRRPLINKIDVKIPEVAIAEIEKRPKKNKPKKTKVVGDIHIRPYHLRVVGADLCKTLFLFFNEPIKLKKLQTLRKISK